MKDIKANITMHLEEQNKKTRCDSCNAVWSHASSVKYCLIVNNAKGACSKTVEKYICFYCLKRFNRIISWAS